MELVTPEEIAEYAVFEMRGGNTGKDIIQGIDAFALGPTYRGGYLRNEAVKRLNHLENETGKKSVAFELLGPPRLSKLLHEANLIGQVESNVKNILNVDTSELTSKGQRSDKIKCRIKKPNIINRASDIARQWKVPER